MSAPIKERSAAEVAMRDGLARDALIAQLRHPTVNLEKLGAVAHMFAADAYAIADAMLAERERGGAA